MVANSVVAGAEIENDVIFVVEGTANLLLDFENLMKSYIEPANSECNPKFLVSTHQSFLLCKFIYSRGK